MIHTNDRKTHPVLLIFLWKLYITDDILFVLIVLTTRHFRCSSLSFTNTSPYPFKDFDVICCLLSDETGGLLDQQEPLLGHSLSWEINKPPNQTGTNRYSAKVWVPEIPTESDLINLSSYSNDFHQYLWWFFSKTNPEVLPKRNTYWLVADDIVRHICKAKVWTKCIEIRKILWLLNHRKIKIHLPKLPVKRLLCGVIFLDNAMQNAMLDAWQWWRHSIIVLVDSYLFVEYRTKQLFIFMLYL